MKEEETLREFESLMGELKLLMSSFSPDSKLAELIKQATLAAHEKSKLHENMNAIRIILIVIAFLVILFGVASLFLMWGLAS